MPPAWLPHTGGNRSHAPGASFFALKLEPSFPDHWKTEALVKRCGAEAVLCLLRLWGQAQIQRKWTGLELTPKTLALKTKWLGDENHLWDAFTDPHTGWLDAMEDGTWEIHQFAEHNRQVVHLWEAGRKGGRPQRNTQTKPKPKEQTGDNTHTLPLSPFGSHMETKWFSNGSEAPSPDADFSEFRNGTDLAKAHDWVAGLFQSTCLSAAELDALKTNARAFLSLSDDDRRTIEAFQRVPASKLETGGAWHRPSKCLFWIRDLPEVLRQARRWQGKNGKAPKKVNAHGFH